MKKLDLKPNIENLTNTFIEDSIGRTNDVCSFVQLLVSADSCSLGIDGKWGTGKTFFVKQTKLVFDSFNPNASFYETEEAARIRKKYLDVYRKQEEDFLPVVTAYYDAWQHDDEEEPVLSLLYQIMKENYNGRAGNIKRSWTEILASVAGIVCDRDIRTALKEFKGEDIFSEQKQNEDIDLLIESFFKSFLPEKGNRLVVFVDELDRCAPTFAVKLLERIKHYFLCDNVIFVFSVNFGELQNTVKSFYGNEFDACRYMDRFFDVRMEMPPVDMEKYVRSIGLHGNRNLRQEICIEVIRQMHLGMRETSRFLQMSKTCAYKYTDGDGYEKQRFLSHDGGYSDLIGYCVVVPIAIGLKLIDTDQYDDFISGKDSSWLENIVLSEAIGDWVTGHLLDNGETYQKVEGKKQVTEKQKIQDVYDAIFVKAYLRGEYETKIGKAIFEKGFKDRVLKAIALVSPYADYSV